MSRETREIHTAIMATAAAVLGVVLVVMLWYGIAVQDHEAALARAEREYRRAAILKIEERLDLFGQRLEAVEKN